MGNVRWTDDQLRAIETRGSSVLVSAAAGSGKTAVLVERLLRRIVDEGIDITRFLIITYTKAAAGELRRKISDALRKYVAEHPENKRVRRNLALVGSARISTVHSFCTWVLRNYGGAYEFAGGFRVLEEAEGKVILEEVLSELIEEKYEEGSPSFLALAGHMSDARSDRSLFAAVLEMYRKSLSHPYPERWLKKMVELYNIQEASGIRDTIWGEENFLKAREILEKSVFAMRVMLADADRASDTSTLYHDVLTDMCAALEKCVAEDWNKLRENLSELSFAKLPSSGSVADKTVPERIKAVYGKVRDDIRKKILEELLPASSEELMLEITELSGYVKSLSELTLNLCERFAREKLHRSVLDYSDLEHYTINLLISEYDDEEDAVLPSEIGREISENFDEILLDEFQDSNVIQDIIFRAVSRDDKNIVMVGDVKQSIYGFRLADPSIFMKKYKSFKKYDEASGDEPRYITLARNFRSRAEVLDASNSIFSRIMTEKLGGVDYTEEHRLVPRDEIPDADRKDMGCEFCIIDTDGDAEEKGIEAEARFTAAKIYELVSSGFEIYDKDEGKRPVRYSDFAVLLRSVKSVAPVYEKAFSELGIPYVSPVSEGLLQKNEISAVLAYLSVIDNPTRDVQLLAALRSPMFAFSADDLCYIRRAGRGSLIDAMKKLSKEDGATAKCKSFLEGLSRLRAIAKGKDIGELIWEVYNRTNALGVFGALSCGEERQRNLIEFFKCAEALEKSGYVSLYKFVSHIARIAERNGDLAAPPANAAGGVTIMTMHKSKGLEFPVVFVGNAIRSFNLDDIKGPVLIHSKLGVGMRIKDEELGIDCSSFMRDTIRRKILEEQKSEEMRLLYVALTRAREKLYITASYKNAARTIAKISNENAYPQLDGINLALRNDAQLWLILPLIRTSAGREILAYAGFESFEEEKLKGLSAYVVRAEEIEKREVKALEVESEEKKELSAAFLRDSYPYARALLTPSKVTATGISAAKDKSEKRIVRHRAERPRFMREKKLTPAERGTALHMAMQFADFKNCKTEEGAKMELLRLLSEEYLTKKQYESVGADKISGFVASDIGREMLSAKEVCREFKFSVLMPANEIFKETELSGEKVLLQGVMDMYYETENGITIVDFKTDKKRPEGEAFKKYADQLRTYKSALYEMTGKKAKRLVLYLVSLGDYMEV